MLPNKFLQNTARVPGQFRRATLGKQVHVHKVTGLKEIYLKCGLLGFGVFLILKLRFGTY